MIASLGPKYPSTVPTPPAVKSTFDCIAWHNLAGVFLIYGIFDSILMSYYFILFISMCGELLCRRRTGGLADWPAQGHAAQAIWTITALERLYHDVNYSSCSPCTRMCVNDINGNEHFSIRVCVQMPATLSVTRGEMTARWCLRRNHRDVAATMRR
jgi:hypothetical protein